VWFVNVTGLFAHAETLYKICFGFASIISKIFWKNSEKSAADYGDSA